MRATALGLLLLSVSGSTGLTAGCTAPPAYYTPGYAALEQVQPGATPEQVLQAMGNPSSRENGWWRSAWVSYSTDYHVWNYRGIGRVIFDRGTRTVVATEADPHESGDGGDDLM